MKKEERELNMELKRSIIRKRNCESNLLILKYQKEEKEFKKTFREPTSHLLEVKEPKDNIVLISLVFLFAFTSIFQFILAFL